jgi:hypothetical protein
LVTLSHPYLSIFVSAFCPSMCLLLNILFYLDLSVGLLASAGYHASIGDWFLSSDFGT